MFRILTTTALTAFALTGGALADTVRIGYIDTLSGALGPAGDASLKHFEYAAELINAEGGMGGMPVEIVAFDNKLSPTESLQQLQKAIDQGIRIIAQGNGSSVAHALVEAVDKHNRRNPGEEVIYLNFAAVDPALTNEDCSFWHFRFDAHVDMKMAALTDWLAEQPEIKSVYILGQDYSFGRAVADAATRMIAEKRPDIEIVGNELHPIAKVKDFTPYVQKMMAADADAVITGNWGSDMALLIKAAADAGQEVPYLTFYGGGLGAPKAMGASAVGLVKQVTENHSNVPVPAEQFAKIDEFQAKYPGVDYFYQRVFNTMDMLDAAVEEVGSLDVTAIAYALENASLETPYGTVTMRADDHQAIQPLYLSTFSDAVERDVEGTGFGFATDKVIAAEATEQPHSCRMRRP